MEYVVTFLEGIISFISPCMLPMIPVYISYFAGNANERKNILPKALFFVLGFTAVFSIMGVFAGTISSLLTKYQTAVNLITGVVVIILGLGFIDVIPLHFFKGNSREVKVTGVISAFVFGVVFSLSLTPCVGAFLGSALMLASASGTVLKGFSLLLVYSLGLGIPFVLSAVLIEKLASVFNWIKKHYGVINNVCGGFLIIIGILMMTGRFSEFLNFLR